MGKPFQGQRLEWTEENLEFAIGSIKRNLTRELVSKQWKPFNEMNPNAGHCHNAAGSLYMLFGPEHLEIWRGPAVDIEDQLHFWCVRKDTNTIVDITEAQYRLGYDHNLGNKSTMLSHNGYYNAKEVYLRVLNNYNQTNINLF